MNGMEEHPQEEQQLIESMLIPEYILDGKDAPEKSEDKTVATTPVLVFVNGKSGGQLGNKMIPLFRKLLNPKQVHELPKEKPDEVLREFLGHLEKLKSQGDRVAAEIRSRLRLVVAGGDGTHGWLLGAVADLKLDILPPVATIPLGTGNNLPFSFGWGKKNPLPTEAAMRELLRNTAEASPISCDRWDVVIRMSYALEDSPLKRMETRKKSEVKLRSLSQVPSFQSVSTTNAIYEEGRHSYQGEFWNYLSIGMDSQASYAFHEARQAHPEKFKNQLMNQSRYAALAVSQGWFCATCLHPRSKNINSLADIYVAKYDGEWTKLDITPSIRSILMLNLPSFSGGLNPWGDPGKTKAAQRGLTSPYVNDGLIEIVGFRDAWHGMVLFAPHTNSHGTRLAQANKVKIEFHEGGVNHTFMRVDGEPWMQQLPSSDKPTVMEISHHGQAVILGCGDCSAKPLPSDSGDLPITTASFHSVQRDPSGSMQSIHETKDEEEAEVDSTPPPSKMETQS